MPSPAPEFQPLPRPIHRDAALEAQLRQRLAAFERRAYEGPVTTRAAVALVVVDEGEGADLPGLPRFPAASPSPRAALLLTRRAATLRRHAGQWALPGGRIDAGETAEQAALRELHEEVGLALTPSHILGRLDDFATRSGFVITPFVMWGGPGAALQPNTDEVGSVHRIPVEEFLRPDAPLLDALHGSEHPVLRMPVGDSWIAAPTAALLYQFRELCLLGRPTRVAHFEQPKFAWK